MGSATREVVQESMQGTSERGLSAQQTTQTTTEVSLGNASGGPVAFTDESAGQFGGRVSTFDRVNAQTRDVTTVSGGRESVAAQEGGFQTSTSTQQSAVVQTETQGASETTLISSESTRQSLEASAGAGLSIESAGGRVTFAESVGQYGGEYGGRVGEGAVDVTIAAGREIARETGMEGESTREVKKSTQLTPGTSAHITQTSAQEITQMSAQEVSQSSTITQQVGEGSLNQVTVTNPKAHSATDSNRNYRGQVERAREETVEVTILAGTEDVEARQTMTGGVVQESARDIAPSLTQVKATNSVGNRGSRVGEETVGVTILTGTEAVEARQTVTSGVVQGSTRDIVQSSAQVTTTEVSGDRAIA